MLTFDHNSHTYRHEGRRVPSVTQVIKAAGLIDDRWFTETAAWRGSVVHRCCELDDLKRLKEDSVDPGARGYLEAWRACRESLGLRVLEVEQRKLHGILMYAGTPDVLALMPSGEFAVIDRKTGASSKWHALQLAAYVQFFPNPARILRYTVRLQSDARYVLTEYPVNTLALDWQVFQAALAVTNWRQIHGC